MDMTENFKYLSNYLDILAKQWLNFQINSQEDFQASEESINKLLEALNEIKTYVENSEITELSHYLKERGK